MATRLRGADQPQSTAQTSEGAPYVEIASRILFYPAKYPVGNWTPHDLRFRDVWFKADDGSRLHGWFCKADRERATILFTHGNGGNIATRVPWLTYLQTNLNVSVFVFDYRGYGRSEGVPTMDGVVQDARAARRALREVPGADTNVLLMGESLGGAIAVQLAAESAPRALILQSTFTSLTDMAELRYPQLSSIVPKSALNSSTLMPSIHCPLLQSHGTADAALFCRLKPMDLPHPELVHIDILKSACGRTNFSPRPAEMVAETVAEIVVATRRSFAIFRAPFARESNGQHRQIFTANADN